MDYSDNEDEQNGVTKWPFYMAALFIISLVIGFAFLHLKVSETLDQWQLTTCILASGLASILVFIPHLIDRFLVLAFDPSKRKDEELHRKTYFDIKEMKSQLEAFSVKIDKVPTLVDKIVSSAPNQNSETTPTLAQIPEDLEGIKNTLLQRMKDIEELVVQTPLLPEPDPAISDIAQNIPLIQNSIESLSRDVSDLQKLIKTLPSTLAEPVLIETTAPKSSPNIAEKVVDSTFTPESNPQLIEDNDVSTDGENDLPSKTALKEDPLSQIQELDKQLNEIVQETEETGEINPDEFQQDSAMEAAPEKIIQSSSHDQNQDTREEEKVDISKESTKNLIESEENEGLSDKIATGEESTYESSYQDESNKGELDLNLPDPAETLRKVDAILQETDPSHIPEAQIELKKKEETSPKKSSTGTTSVVANVMIGIGNKPYLRGEGPGLSCDEGVPMNFIEIGKWAWSPSRKNASLTVQLYRNDNDPDQSGKIEVKAGEKIEITPDFG